MQLTKSQIRRVMFSLLAASLCILVIMMVDGNFSVMGGWFFRIGYLVVPACLLIALFLKGRGKDEVLKK